MNRIPENKIEGDMREKIEGHNLRLQGIRTQHAELWETIAEIYLKYIKFSEEVNKLHRRIDKISEERKSLSFSIKEKNNGK